MKLAIGSAHSLFVALTSVDRDDKTKLDGKTRIAIAIDINLLQPHVAAYERVRGERQREIMASESGPAQGAAFVEADAQLREAEVEVALSEHPAIADVVVIGLTDAAWGKRVHAIVAPADPAHPPTSDEVITYAKERLAPYKVPKTVELVAVIPRSEAGKVSRGALIAEREPSS